MREEFESLIKKITISEMPNNDMKCVAETCGVDVAVKLLRNLPGALINIPQRAFNKVADKFVISKFDGSNAKKLAQITGYSHNHVYRIVRRENELRKSRKRNTASEK
jgi:Mor family transcriptional regulator